MRNSSFRAQQITASFIALLGIYVMVGWLVGSETMVRVVLGSVSMGLNTSLLFIGAALCVFPQSRKRQFVFNPDVYAWFLVILSGLILVEHWGDINLGIDWVALHAHVKDGNSRPGRVSPNACIGFFLTGIACLLFRRMRPTSSKMQKVFAEVLVYTVLAIGLIAAIGYVLRLEAMYRFAQYNRMAAATAVGMSLIGFALWLRLCQVCRGSKHIQSPDDRIVKAAAVILTIVALVTGLTGFAILKQQYEQSVSDALLRTTNLSAGAFEAQIDQQLVMVSLIATRSALPPFLSKLSDNPHDREARRQLEDFGRSFFSSGVSGLRFLNARGEDILAIGTIARSTALRGTPIGRPRYKAALLWQDGLVLVAEAEVALEGRVVGKFIVEQRMPSLSKLLSLSRQESISTDALICARRGDEAVCFPSRFYLAGVHFPMFKEGQPNLAAPRALLNQHGVFSTADLRGVQVLAGYAPIGTTGLGIVLKEDKSELNIPVRNRFNIFLGLLILMVGGGTWVLRLQVQPLSRRLVKDQRRMEVIIESSHEAFIEIDQGGTITGWNAQAERTFGWSRPEALGQSLVEIIIPYALREAHKKGFAQFLKTGEGSVLGKRIELPAQHRSGAEFLVEITISAIKSDEGYSFTAFMHDISDRKKSEIALLSEKERLRVTLNSIGDAVITTDTAGAVMFLNPVAEFMTGWENSAAIGLPLSTVFQIIQEQTGDVAPNPVECVLATGKISALANNTVLIQRGGLRFAIEDSAAPIRDPLDQIIGVVLVFHDVSHARKMAAEMTYQATHDALTGLINRREFEHRVELALQSAQQQGKQHTLLYLDLDQFKIVNDTGGHVAGDELLRQLTMLLLEKLRKSDTMARLGGDEFGILLDSCSTHPAKNIADTLRQAARDFHFVWEDKVFPIGLSIGLVTFSADFTLADILRMADAACYVAKDKGRNRVHVFTVDDKEVAQRHGEMGWIGRIQKALDEQRFVLYSQKIRPLGAASEREDHYELLLRMKDEDGSLIPPMAFIPAAERYGLMPLLDRWVIQSAFSQHAGRHPAGTRQGTCAINLSATSICDEQFLEFVKEQFLLYSVVPASICFEVTETSAIANLSKAVALIRELKALGCRFSLDDFGSGMSSFAYLKQLPVDYLKIDGGFVKDMMSNPIDHAMVESIHHIGHVMGIQTIAEFVENDEILEALKKIGVDFAQGYGVEKPRPAWQ